MDNLEPLSPRLTGRIICFTADQNDGSSGIKALKRTDKGSINSMVDILHIDGDLPKESLRDAIVDFREQSTP
jgi:hypothetical protein